MALLRTIQNTHKINKHKNITPKYICIKKGIFQCREPSAPITKTTTPTKKS